MDWFSSGLFTFACILFLIIGIRVCHITYSTKITGYSKNDFTMIPYYLMQANCFFIMIISINYMLGSD